MPFVDPPDPFAKPPRPSQVAPREHRNDVERDGVYGELRDVVIAGELTGLEGCDELELNGCRLNGVSFESAANLRLDVVDCVFVNCDLSQTEFRAASRVDFDACKLVGTDFSNGHVSDVRFAGGTCRYVNFRLSTLDRVAFESCQLDEVDAYGARLTDVSFDRSELRRFSLDQAELKQVDFRGAMTLDLTSVGGLRGGLVSENQINLIAVQFALASGIDIERAGLP